NAIIAAVLPGSVNGMERPVESIGNDFPYSEDFPQLISNDPAIAAVFNLIIRQMLSNDKVLRAILNSKVDNAEIKTVARTGSYTDLANIPTEFNPATHSHSQYLTEHQDVSGKADKATTLEGYGITDAYTKTDINNKLTSAMVYKGSVETAAQLPSLYNKIGDFYNVLDTGVNYAWDGTAWDEMGGMAYISEYLKNYYTSTEVENKLSGYAVPNGTYANMSVGHASAADVTPWAGISNKPSTFTPSSHTHDDRYYTESEVDNKLSGKANSSHTHSQYLTSHATVDSSLSSTSTNAVQNKVVNSALAGKAASSHTHDDRYYTESEVNTKLNAKADSSHSHSAATQSAAGFMSAADKKKLDGLDAAGGGTKFTYIYPNGGTANAPAEVTINQRFVMDNPFPGYYVMCAPELKYNGHWGVVGQFVTPSDYGSGVSANQLDNDKIVVQTGSSKIIFNSSSHQGDPFGRAEGTGQTKLPCRIRVWTIGKI
uniref:hypothetical protein n=1 Tax=Anaerovibrio sp. TaxID=1872532 RepID=UPI0025EA9482